MTFSGRFVLSMIQYAASNGGSMSELMALSGQDYDFLCQEDSRVSSAVYNRVLENAVSQTNDPFFGLHAGEYLNLSAAGLIGQITQTSATVKEALDYCCEFANLGCRALPMKLEEVSNGYRLDFIPDKMWATESEMATIHTIEGTLAFTLREFHLLTIQHYYPKEIGVARPKSGNESELERVFKCPLVYDQKNYYILFDKEQVEKKVVTSDYKLLRMLVSYAEEKMSRIKEEEGFFALVRTAVINMMHPYFPSVEDVAGNMNISKRTLQRKLKLEGTSFKNVVESLKEEMARNYLTKKELSIKEISDMLGYADTSAFTRAFKNRTGSSPSAFQEQV